MSVVLVHFDSHAEVGLKCDAAACTKVAYTTHLYAPPVRQELAARGWRTGIAVTDPGPPRLDYCPAHVSIMDGR